MAQTTASGAPIPLVVGARALEARELGTLGRAVHVAAVARRAQHPELATATASDRPTKHARPAHGLSVSGPRARKRGSSSGLAARASLRPARRARGPGDANSGSSTLARGRDPRLTQQHAAPYRHAILTWGWACGSLVIPVKVAPFETGGDISYRDRASRRTPLGAPWCPGDPPADGARAGAARTGARAELEQLRWIEIG